MPADTFLAPISAHRAMIQVDIASTAFHSQVTFSTTFTRSPGHGEDEIRAINWPRSRWPLKA